MGQREDVRTDGLCAGAVLLPEDKQLEVTLYERNGGRTLTFCVQQEDLLRAERIDNLKLRW